MSGCQLLRKCGWQSGTPPGQSEPHWQHTGHAVAGVWYSFAQALMCELEYRLAVEAELARRAAKAGT